MLLIDRDIFGQGDISIPPITDADFEANKQYAEKRIREYLPLVKSALGGKQAKKLQTEMAQYTSREAMDYIGGKDWKAVFDIILQIACSEFIENQYIYSTPEFRKSLTADVLLEKCRILKLDNQVIVNVLNRCGYSEQAEKIAG